MSAPQQVLAGVRTNDPYYANTVLLLHCDGSNGSTTFTDNSPIGNTVTASGTTVSTSRFKFGTGSGLFSAGSTSNLKLPAGATWNFSTGDWTVEMFVYVTSYNAQTSRLFQTADGDLAVSIYMTMDNVGNLVLSASSNGVFPPNLFSASAATPIGLNAWTHVAYVRNGNNFTAYVNGVGTLVATTSSSLYYSAAQVPVIGGQTSPQRSLNGNIDEVRITKGVARYTANFTPPAQAFPNY